MAETRPEGAWSLEVVRGADVGRRFALPGGETVAGNALNGVPGLDLAPQESGPRRMAARQARFQCAADALTLFDLGSPGGTFVNRERLVPFQARSLRPGDVIQMAGVQLRVERGLVTAAPAPSAPPSARPAGAPSSGFTFTMKSGMACRTWDDFLTASAQDWAGLREELVSGRLAAFLASTGRAALVPDPNAPGTPDDRLDAWLATVPSTRTPAPELEVHPDRLDVQATPGGGTTRRTFAITNTGYRLLKTTARVDPADTSWLRLADGFAGRAFTTADRTSLPLDVIVPERLESTLTASLVLESNGGERRVPVTLRPKAVDEPLPEDEPEAVPSGWAFSGVVGPLRRTTPRVRLIAGAAAGLVGRLVLGLASALFARPDGPTPALLGPAILGAALGALGGVSLIRKRGGIADAPAGAVTGGVAGVLGAAVVVAACRSVESAISAAPALWWAAPLWGVIGAALAGLSMLLVPHAGHAETTP
jgi:hypothetical protein